MRVAVGLALVLLAPGFAGCVGTTSEEGIDAASQDAVNASDELEDVQEALDAGEPSANVDVLGAWKNGVSEEADPHQDKIFVDRGDKVAILDVSKKDDPEKVGEIADLPTALDVKVSDDGNYAFIGDDTSGSTEATGGTGPFTGGVYVFDVSDPRSPERVAYAPVGADRGPHMVYYQQTGDGRELVFSASGNDVTIHEFDRDADELEELASYEPGQLAQDRDPNRVGALYNPQAWLHDMFVMEEEDGTLMMYVAAWDAGLHIVDVTDPGSPEQLGTWSDFGDDEAGNLHTVATDWIGDRRITVGSVEVGFAVVGGTLYATGDEKSVTYVWDTTDPDQPELLGTWTNPVDPTSGRDYAPDEEISSTHNLQLENGRIYQAHYDLGVWVIDVSTPAHQSDPATVGYHYTDEMGTWDVVLNDGVMYTSGDVGVKALTFALDEPGNGLFSRA
ncbi:hypothetical protein BRD56_06140 [Thermoplasmatales archaeon SW_10_69_26]|nr:MAG: hypothetical protein BRD56_06140 [Thermoplasmatales archaeon SW_10_69_26]